MSVVATQTMETRMDRFIRRENVRHYRELLKTVKNEAERQKILKLLADEQQKQKDAGDKIEGQ
jgi:chemotaxis methyl-accepting protein methylase